jgi:hypothetical protein
MAMRYLETVLTCLGIKTSERLDPMVTTATVVGHQANSGHQTDTMITAKVVVVVEDMVEVVVVVITVLVHTVVVTRDLVVAGTLVVVTTVKVEVGQGDIQEVHQEVIHVVDIVVHTVQVVVHLVTKDRVAVIVMTHVNVLANDGVLHLTPVIVVQDIRAKVESQVQVSHLTLMLLAVTVSLIRCLQQTVNR